MFPNGVDVIVHAAGMNAQECAKNPEHALAVNGVATAELVNAAVIQGVKKFIYLSTAHVYSAPLVGTITEKSQTTNLHPYATSHLAGESSVLAAHQSDNIDGIVLRLSNSFGAPTHKLVNCWMLLINDLCQQAVMNGKLVLNSSGTQMRDFVPLTDVCRTIEYLIQKDSSQFESPIFNVCSGVSYKVIDVAQMIKRSCMNSLKFSPDIQRLEIPEEDNSEILDYKMTWLNAEEFNFSTSMNDEIEQLLYFCKKNFMRDRLK